MNGLGEHVMVFEYPVVVHLEDGSVWVSCPDVPEMACAGDTSEEALFDAVDALESALSFYVDQKKAIPLPATPTEGQPVVRLPALTAAKAALWNTMVAQKNQQDRDGAPTWSESSPGRSSGRSAAPFQDRAGRACAARVGTTDRAFSRSCVVHSPSRHRWRLD